MTWQTGGGQTQGYRVAYAQGNYPSLTCQMGSTQDVESALTVTLSTYAATLYTVVVCAYDSGNNLSAPVLQTITTSTAIQPPQVIQQPVVSNGFLTVAENLPANGTLSVTVPGNPANPPELQVVTPPTNGTVIITNPVTGSYTYTPKTGFVGSDSFTFNSTNGLNLVSNTAQISIMVSSAPLALGNYLTVVENSFAFGLLPVNDVENTNLTYSFPTGPSHGTVTITEANITHTTPEGVALYGASFIYVPNANYTGSDSFTFQANDGTFNSNIATVTITVISPPAAVPTSSPAPPPAVLPASIPPVVGDSGFEMPDMTTTVGAAPANWGAPLGTAWTFLASNGFAGIAGNGSKYTSANPVAPEGTQVGVISLNASMSQPLAFSAGTYYVSFSAAQEATGNTSNQSIGVSLNGNLIANITPANTSYQTYNTSNFALAAGSYTLTLVGQTSSGESTALIDNVQIQGVALPALPVSAALPTPTPPTTGAALPPTNLVLGQPTTGNFLTVGWKSGGGARKDSKLTLSKDTFPI